MLKYGLSRENTLSQVKSIRSSNEKLKDKSFAYRVWKIKHRLIVDSINTTGDFDLTKITYKAKEMAALEE